MKPTRPLKREPAPRPPCTTEGCKNLAMYFNDGKCFTCNGIGGKKKTIKVLTVKKQ